MTAQTRSELSRDSKLRPTVTARLAALRGDMARNGVVAFLTSAPTTQTYLCGFRARNYSRLILLFVTAEASSLVVPGLEEVNATRHAVCDEVLPYYEHP